MKWIDRPLPAWLARPLMRLAAASYARDCRRLAGRLERWPVHQSVTHLNGLADAFEQLSKGKIKR